MNGRDSTASTLTQEDIKIIKEVIRNGMSRESVEYAEKFANELGDFEPTQMYRIFTELNRLYSNLDRLKEEEIIKRLLILRSRVAYTFARILDRARRKNKIGIEKFRKIMAKGIDLLTSGEDLDLKESYKNFYFFFESILAYHKAYCVANKAKV